MTFAAKFPNPMTNMFATPANVPQAPNRPTPAALPDAMTIHGMKKGVRLPTRWLASANGQVASCAANEWKSMTARLAIAPAP